MRALPPLPNMPSHVVELVRQIPPGSVSTYGRLAEALGDAVAARWVGHFLLHHDPQLECPVHRVVRSTGHLGGYALGTMDEKAERLRAEGVKVSADGTVELARFRFDQFVSDHPLRALRALQRELAAEQSLENHVRRPQLAGGVDISYDLKRAEGVATHALVEVNTGRLLHSTTVRAGVPFPYISSYLAFRELPLLVQLWQEVGNQKDLADVILVDGSGILHPLAAGVATHFGIVIGRPTIGVTKKHLCGQVEIAGMEPGELRNVTVDRRKRGAALRPHVKSRRPLYISPGHLVSVDAAVRTVVRLLGGHRLPEPIYWADRISRREARRT